MRRRRCGGGGEGEKVRGKGVAPCSVTMVGEMVGCPGASSWLSVTPRAQKSSPTLPVLYSTTSTLCTWSYNCARGKQMMNAISYKQAAMPSSSVPVVPC